MYLQAICGLQILHSHRCHFNVDVKCVDKERDELSPYRNRERVAPSRITAAACAALLSPLILIYLINLFIDQVPCLAPLSLTERGRLL